VPVRGSEGSITRLMGRFVAALLFGALTAATAGAQPPAPVIEHYHVDALGSVRAVTDTSGQLVRRHDYLPFGEENGVPGADARRFTGKERDQETGLDYFGGRYYAQRMGRFTTVDPVLNVEAAIATSSKTRKATFCRSGKFSEKDRRFAKSA
jgi:RHS repeat-associated protein